MIDAPDQKEARFPPDKEGIAAEAIARKLDELGAGQKDLALCSGACGGDILFAEACNKLGLRLEIRIPFDEHTFLKITPPSLGRAGATGLCRQEQPPDDSFHDTGGTWPDAGQCKPLSKKQ
jgi:hypothetical protein